MMKSKSSLSIVGNGGGNELTLKSLKAKWLGGDGSRQQMTENKPVVVDTHNLLQPEQQGNAPPPRPQQRNEGTRRVSWSDSNHDPLESGVVYVEIDPSKIEAWNDIKSNVDQHLKAEARAKHALIGLTLLYNQLKQQHPHRFTRHFEELLEDCTRFVLEDDINALLKELQALERGTTVAVEVSQFESYL